MEQTPQAPIQEESAVSLTQSDSVQNMDDAQQPADQEYVNVGPASFTAPQPDKNGVIAIGEVDETEIAYSPEEFASLEKWYDNSFKRNPENEIIRGRIIQITDNEIVVDIGFKSEGIIPSDEFPNLEELHLDDEIEVFLESMENKEGTIVLSKKKADFYKVWDQIKKDYEDNTLVDGFLAKRIKGGMVAKIYGVEAFLPGSQIDIKQVTDFERYVGQTIPVKIIKVNKTRRNIVVSRRAVLEEEREKKRDEILRHIEKGMIVEGIVKNITDFGVFIDLGGVDGLLHITDMSWGRINHPSEMLKISDRIKIKVIEYDKQKQRISLGLKQMEPYPWEKVEEKYPIGSKIKGKVVSLTDYGAFVELEKGIEGLIHISEMSWTQHVKHPSQVLKVGEDIEAIVLNVNRGDEKISLGLKQVNPDPWEVAAEKYPNGTQLRGSVKNLTNFGAFIEIEDGIEGLVHISDISWTKRIRHPNELLKKGDEIDVLVLGFDRENRRISLGMKQIMDDPWKIHSQEFAPGKETMGTIRKVLEKGLIIDLNYDLEGFVPVSQVGPFINKKPSDFFFDGMDVPMKVIELDNENRRIVLSVKEYFDTRTEDERQAFLDNIKK